MGHPLQYTSLFIVSFWREGGALATDGGIPPEFIDPSVEDDDVPTERVETCTVNRYVRRRSERFLKEPIPLPWIRKHVACSADRLLLVLRAHADMKCSMELRVTGDVLRDAGIVDRKAAYRALKRLEVSGTLTVTRKRGRRPLVRFRDLDGKP